MEKLKKGSATDWAIFFVSLIVISIMLYLPGTRPWFWLVLPFVCTWFVKGMGIM